MYNYLVSVNNRSITEYIWKLTFYKRKKQAYPKKIESNNAESLWLLNTQLQRETYWLLGL